MGQTEKTASTEALSEAVSVQDIDGRLKLLAETARHAVFTTSLGIEDQVLTAAIAESGAAIRIVTLETGRLLDETLALIERTEQRYSVYIEQIRPDPGDVADYIRTYGSNGFYDSVEARHACCTVRKLMPLRRALAGSDMWITGLRRGQSDMRATVPFVTWDGDRGLLKASPLADWDRPVIETFAERNAVPTNPLHAKGYPSIGCAPCTRAIRPGEPERAGRWWWEHDHSRECGLHVDTPESAGHV